MGRGLLAAALVLAGALLVALLVVVSACAPTRAGDASAIADKVMLTATDFGAEPSDGRPDAGTHPLPPDPCGETDPSPAPDGPVAERSITASDGTHVAYEYVARYPDGRAAGVFADLAAALDRCKGAETDGTGPEERYRVLARYAAGVLVERDYDSFTSSYFLGYAGDYLVAVLDVGARVKSGDSTYVNGLGMRALERAGGAAGPMQPGG
jgi:hypothetical protein